MARAAGASGAASPEGEAAEPSRTKAAAGEDDAAAAGSGAADEASYRTGSKHFREVLEDWEAFILNDDLADDSLLDDDFA